MSSLVRGEMSVTNIMAIVTYYLIIFEINFKN